MPRQTRRSFLEQTTRGTAAVALGDLRRSGDPGPGRQLSESSWKWPACGAHRRRGAPQAGCQDRLHVRSRPRPRRNASRRSSHEQAVADLRKILDDHAVDAIVIATPDHWHAAAAILACHAGKHVYVEKPCSHNIAEGRRMIEAARHSGRVMQVGTQTRSTKVFQDAIALVREGAVGRVLIAKTWTSQQRKNIGHCQPSHRPPEWTTTCGSARADDALPGEPFSLHLALVVQLRHRRRRQPRRAPDGHRPVGAGHEDASDAGGRLLRQNVFRRRPAVPRHAVRHVRISRRRHREAASNC